MKYFCINCECEVELDTNSLSNVENRMIEKGLCHNCIKEKCEHCGDLTDETFRVYDVEEEEYIRVCEDCYDGRVFYCEIHGRDEIGESTYVNNFGRVCMDEFRWGDFFTCPSCDSHYHLDDGYWDDDNEEYYCYDCYEEIMDSRVIKRYHNHQDEYEFEKRRTSKDREEGNTLYFGMELEVENIGFRMSNDGVARQLIDITDDFVYEHDGSLDEGFEIISMPFTKDYMLNNLQFDLIKMLNKLKFKGFNSTDTCGLHFHMTKDNWMTTVQMASLMEYYRSELIKLSKREEAKIRRWSSFYTCLAKSELCRFGVNGVEREMEDNDSRYRALNIRNRDTIEVRIFKGTTNIAELMARWELVANFYQWASENALDNDFDNIPSFYELATYGMNNFIGDYLAIEFPELCDEEEKATF